MLPRFSRPALLLAAVHAVTACRVYVPLAQPPPPGGRIVVDLTDAGARELADRIGAGAAAVEGDLVEATDSTLGLNVRTVRKRNGVESFWSGEPVRVPRQFVAHLGERRLSRGRTALAIGALFAAAGVLAVVVGSGGGQATGRGPGGGGPR
jgi:hypothetical protein